MPESHPERSYLEAASRLNRKLAAMDFSAVATHVYNPLVYALEPYTLYLKKYGGGTKRVLFLGMNPGPFGMAQTGVPFGEVAAARDWLQVEAPVSKPANEHPARPVDGFQCARSEVSGRRLWGYFAERFGTAADFFCGHFVFNYCPLLFLEANGKRCRNLTPDKFPAALAGPLYAACDEHLRAIVAGMQPEWVIGVGKFAESRAAEALTGTSVKIGTVLHPSPASPAANRGWAEQASRQLEALNIW